MFPSLCMHMCNFRVLYHAEWPTGVTYLLFLWGFFLKLKTMKSLPAEEEIGSNCETCFPKERVMHIYVCHDTSTFYFNYADFDYNFHFLKRCDCMGWLPEKHIFSYALFLGLTWRLEIDFHFTCYFFTGICSQLTFY